jgi:hypothetical protein
MTTPNPNPTIELGTLAQWAGATATFLVVLVALFKDGVLRWWRRPKLTVSISLASPDCHKTQMTYESQHNYLVADCYYLRLWVKNLGRTRAEQVQVFAEKLYQQGAGGSFKEIDRFLPMNLKWSHGHQLSGGPEIFAQGISPQMGKHCDLGHIIDPQFRSFSGEDLADVPPNKTLLALDLEFLSATLSHLISPGTYRLHLRVAAANSTPVPKTLEITVTGEWFKEQDRMFIEGLGIKVVQ